MIQLRGVVKVAASARAVRILDGIDLQVSTGETIGLCGPGGSGKSLLCKIVCGLVPPTAGSVEVFGVALQDARAGDLRDVQRRIGTLFQNNALFDSLSVFDNVAFPLRQAAIASGQAIRRTAVRGAAASSHPLHAHQHPNVDWKREAPAFRERLLQQIGKAGFEKVMPRIRYERVITPADWDTRYEIHHGATFNLAHSLDQMLHLRPRNRFEDLERVYLVGGGTHPGSGLPVIFESARISSRLLLADLGLRSHPAKQSGAKEVAALPVSAV